MPSQSVVVQSIQQSQADHMTRLFHGGNGEPKISGGTADARCNHRGRIDDRAVPVENDQIKAAHLGLDLSKIRCSRSAKALRVSLGGSSPDV